MPTGQVKIAVDNDGHGIRARRVHRRRQIGASGRAGEGNIRALRDALHQSFELGRGLQAGGNGGDDVHIGSARTAGVIWSVGGWDSRSAVSARGDIGLIRGIKYSDGVYRQSG